MRSGGSNGENEGKGVRRSQAVARGNRRRKLLDLILFSAATSLGEFIVWRCVVGYWDSTQGGSLRKVIAYSASFGKFSPRGIEISSARNHTRKGASLVRAKPYLTLARSRTPVTFGRVVMTLVTGLYSPKSYLLFLWINSSREDSQSPFCVIERETKICYKNTLINRIADDVKYCSKFYLYYIIYF